MKRIVIAALIAVMAVSVTGCSDNNTSPGSSGSSRVESGSSRVESGSSQADSGSSDSSSGSSQADSGSTDSTTDADNSQNAGDVNSGSLAEAALNAVEFPSMMEFESAEEISTLIGLDTALCEEYTVYLNAMSVDLNEVIVVKPSSGNEQAVNDVLKEHFDYTVENGAFYPAQEESVAGAVMGTTDGGYIYIIVHALGSQAEEALLAAE